MHNENVGIMRAMIRHITAKSDGRSLPLSHLYTQLEIGMLEKGTSNDSPIYLLEGCEKVALRRTTQRCTALLSLFGDRTTHCCRFVERVDAALAWLAEAKAVSSVEKMLGQDNGV